MDIQRNATLRAAEQAGSFDAGLQAHMVGVFRTMCLGLLITAATAWAVAETPALYAVIFGTPLKWLAMLAPLVFVFVLSFSFAKLSSSALYGLFLTFSAVMGVSLAAIVKHFTGASLASTFVITSAMFAGMALWGYTTKRDLSSLGSFLLMGLIGLIVASIVNLFLASSALSFALSAIGVLIFTLLTAFDVQQQKETYSEHAGTEANGKLAVMGALSLYLNFVNLFQMLLSFVGERDD